MDRSEGGLTGKTSVESGNGKMATFAVISFGAKKT